jgi:hypothetical protein
MTVWTRFGSSSSFVLALVCFCLPWIEIRCDRPRGGLFSGQGTDVLLTTQSGLQMTYGGFTTTVNGKAPTEQEQVEMNRRKGERNLAAPALLLYALCLLAGLAVSIISRDRNRRFLLAGSASLAAVVVLVVQLATGFPMLDGVPRRQGTDGWTYTAWFWLGLVSTLAAFLMSVIDRLVPPMRATESALSSDGTEASTEPLNGLGSQ